jgi:hypothetical protein
MAEQEIYKASFVKRSGWWSRDDLVRCWVKIKERNSLHLAEGKSKTICLRWFERQQVK